MVNYCPALSHSDMQTPCRAPLCLCGQNQETGDMANSEVWSSQPGGGWRLQACPHSTQRNTALTKRSGCTSQPLKACPSNKGGGRSLAHITHDRPPADTLLTGGHLCQNEGHNPWERLTPLCLDTLSLI